MLCSPYQLHPRMDENAKRSRLRETTAPPQGPSTEEKAAAVSGAPSRSGGTAPNAPRTRASAGPYTPLTRMTRAVAVHTSRVETHTSTIPHIPCRAGQSTSAAAWAMAEVPSPASLVNTPRATPYRRAAARVYPIPPPTAASGRSAEQKISAIAPGIWSARAASTAAPPPR